jgi:hypothetical protein
MRVKPDQTWGGLGYIWRGGETRRGSFAMVKDWQGRWQYKERLEGEKRE